MCSVHATTVAKRMSVCGQWNPSRRSVTATPVGITTPLLMNVPVGTTRTTCRGLTITANPAQSLAGLLGSCPVV
jgi:hypothetical protein